MKQMIYVEADTNDADYVTYFAEISDRELKIIKPIIRIIKSRGKNHNWGTSEYADECVEDMYEGQLTEEQIGMMNIYVPYGEFGVHSITQIKIMQIAEEEDLLK